MRSLIMVFFAAATFFMGSIAVYLIDLVDRVDPSPYLYDGHGLGDVILLLTFVLPSMFLGFAVVLPLNDLASKPARRADAGHASDSPPARA